MKEIIIKSEKITVDEYIDFLKRTDLGSQYPQERFESRINSLVNNVNVSLTARDDNGLLVGILFGLSDFAYWLFVTDLGVDRKYTHQGIGHRLVEFAHNLTGGEKNIAIYLVANENAVSFYEKIGMEKAHEVMKYSHIDWTSFTVK